MDDPSSPETPLYRPDTADGERRLLAAIFNSGPVPCICGTAHPVEFYEDDDEEYTVTLVRDQPGADTEACPVCQAGPHHACSSGCTNFLA